MTSFNYFKNLTQKSTTRALRTPEASNHVVLHFRFKQNSRLKATVLTASVINLQTTVNGDFIDDGNRQEATLDALRSGEFGEKLSIS